MSASAAAGEPVPGETLGVLWEDVEVFRAVAGALSFTGAAERLHLGRPAVSRRVQRLERAVGATLFTRSTRRVRLTPAGEALLRATDEMTAIWRRTLGQLAASPGAAVAPPVRVALNSNDVVRAVGELEAAFPGQRWRTEAYGEQASLRALAEGELDVLVGYTAPGEVLPRVAQAAVDFLAAEPIWLAVAADSPWAHRRDGVLLTELAGAAWVASARPVLRRWLDDACAGAGFTPDVRHVTTDADAIRRIVATGSVVSLSAPTVPSGDGIAVVPILQGPRRLLFTGCRPLPLALQTGLPDARERLLGAVRAWYRVAAGRSPRFWAHVLAHPADFPGIAP